MPKNLNPADYLLKIANDPASVSKHISHDKMCKLTQSKFEVISKALANKHMEPIQSRPRVTNFSV